MRKPFQSFCLATALLALPANAEAVQRSTQQAFSVAPGSQLEMKVSGGDILVRVWERSEVSVRATGVDESGLSVEQLGDTVKVTYERRGGGREDAEFEVSVPGSLNLLLQTGGGDLAVEGHLTGRLTVRTGGGDIAFDAVDGNVEIRSSGGDISGKDIGADMSIESMGGDIHLAVINGMAEIESMGGDIHLVRVGASLKTRTMGGDVHVGDVDGPAEVASQGGDVHLGRVSKGVSVKTAGGDIHVASAEGNSDIQTAGGDIQLRNIFGSIEAETAGGDVEVTLTPDSSPSNLVSAGGDIKLIVPGGVKVTVEAIIQVGRWGRDDYTITSDFEAEAGSLMRDEDSIRGIYQINGGGPLVTLKTSSGDIEIRRGAAER